MKFCCKFVLATVVSVIAIRHTSHPCFVLKTKMNVHRDVHRDLASSRGIGFVVDTDMIDPGIHGTAGVANLAQLDLECVCCVLNMQKYALSMGCANRYLMASSTVEVVPKQNANNQVPNVNHRNFCRSFCFIFLAVVENRNAQHTVQICCLRTLRDGVKNILWRSRR